MYDYVYVYIREGTQDRELSGNANEGEQDIHPTTAALSIHTARKRPIQTKQDTRSVLARTRPDAALKAEINKAEMDISPSLMRCRQVKARASVTHSNIQALGVFASWDGFYKQKKGTPTPEANDRSCLRTIQRNYVEWAKKSK